MQDPVRTQEAPPVADITSLVGVLREIRRVVADMDRTEADGKKLVKSDQEFYRAAKLRSLERIELLKTGISAYLKELGQRNLPTPEGTPYFKPVTHIIYPEDKVALLAWVKANVPEAVVESVSTERLAEYIKRTGDAPPGYTEETEERLVIRWPEAV